MDHTPWEVTSRSMADTRLPPSSMAVAALEKIEERMVNSNCFERVERN